MKILRYLKIFLIVIVVSFTFITRIAYADSGFDSNYSYDSSSSDYGYSGSSYSDYDSSSNYDYNSYDYGSGSSHSNGIFDDFYILFFIVSSTLFIIFSDKKRNNNYYKNVKGTTKVKGSFDYYVEQLESKYSTDEKVILSKEEEKELIDILYNNYIEIQNAWMNFDYDKLKELCTDELYNMYLSQLNILKYDNRQNIMNDFSLLRSKIISYIDVNNSNLIRVYMKITLRDYIIDIKTGDVVDGNKHKCIVNNYYMEFIKNNNFDQKKCPGCGASLTDVSKGKCPYCRYIITNVSGKCLLCKKKNMK